VNRKSNEKAGDENAVGCHAFNYQSETPSFRVVDFRKIFCEL